jgi:hypothetical protein
MGSFWKPPAWDTPIDRADGVELFGVPERTIIDGHGWPATFWREVDGRIRLAVDEARHVIQLFRDLAVGEAARCHLPPWGLAMFAGGELLFTATLCYQCDNAYVYTPSGRNLRAFASTRATATALRAVLEKHLPLTE